MNSINRMAIVVEPKEPFLAWARGLEGDVSIDEQSPSDLCSVYLAEADDDEDLEDVLRRHFVDIFEEQLNGWHRVVNDWPSPRSYAMFREWFDVRLVDLVFDLSEGPLLTDEE